MEEKFKVNAAVQARCGTDSIRGIASFTGDRWVSFRSTQFMDPGTEVETLLFLKEPERMAGEVRWALAEPTEDKIVYRMGIWLNPEERVS
jgi:hypothetical protein